MLYIYVNNKYIRFMIELSETIIFSGNLNDHYAKHHLGFINIGSINIHRNKYRKIVMKYYTAGTKKACNK